MALSLRERPGHENFLEIKKKIICVLLQIDINYLDKSMIIIINYMRNEPLLQLFSIFQDSHYAIVDAGRCCVNNNNEKNELFGCGEAEYGKQTKWRRVDE